ncbi:hypothetical protein DITRI_Ditri09bG0060000 [Diplodiscus trichospermus]
MAEGFLNGENAKRKTEDVGSKYFEELVSRSFFQASGEDKSQFMMHNLINDLAQFVGREKYFRRERYEEMNFPSRIRHSSNIVGQCDKIKRFGTIFEAKSLRTFLVYDIHRQYEWFLRNDILCDILQRLKCLRVLSLKGFPITEIPDSIGNLRHLRYLDFSYTKIKSLPDSVCNLYNLETLLLRCCWKIDKLPSKIVMLENLWHLDITGTDSMKEMPNGIGNLTNFRTLSRFIVSQGDALDIREVQNLSNLKGELSISELQNRNEAQCAWETPGLDGLGKIVVDSDPSCQQTEEEDESDKEETTMGPQDEPSDATSIGTPSDETENVDEIEQPNETKGSEVPVDSDVPSEPAADPVVVDEPESAVEVEASETLRSLRRSAQSQTQFGYEYDLSRAKSKTFYSKDNKAVWNFVSKRKLHCERLIRMLDHKKVGMISFLKSQNLFGTVTKIKPYSADIVHEFYANLVSDVADVTSPKCHKVYVRGTLFDFSPRLINEFYEYPVPDELPEITVSMDTVYQVLTGRHGVRWPQADFCYSSDFTMKYVVLHKIAISNWNPAKHTSKVYESLAQLLYKVGTGMPFDLGQHIFDIIMVYSESRNSFGTLPFPSLIYQLLMSQHNIKTSRDKLTNPDNELRTSFGYLSGKHVKDRVADPPYETGTTSVGMQSNALASVATPTAMPSTTSIDNEIMIRFLQSELEQAKQQLEQAMQQQRSATHRVNCLQILLDKFLPEAPITPTAPVAPSDPSQASISNASLSFPIVTVAVGPSNVLASDLPSDATATTTELVDP